MRGNVFMVGLLLLATGCGRLGFTPPDAHGLADSANLPTDAEQSDARQDAGQLDAISDAGVQLNDAGEDAGQDAGPHLDLGPSDTPILDMGREVFGPAEEVPRLAPNGDSTSDPSIYEGVEIIYSRRGASTEPRDLFFAPRSPTGTGFFGGIPVPNLNSTFDDASASLSRDGLTLWFSSTRPGGEGGHDVYVATRNSNFMPWTGLARVPELSTSLADDAPSVAGTMLHAVVAQNTARGDRDLFVVDRNSNQSPWNQPIAINELNTMQDDTTPALSADGLTLYFASNRPPTAGQRDLWVAVRADLFSPFGAPERLVELSTAEDESSPWISFDESRLYFDRGTGPGDRHVFEATK